FANLIAKEENADDFYTLTTDIASLMHDIGIKKSEELLGYNSGKTQEKYGPDEAKKILRFFDFSDEIKDRVYFLISHHHTYGSDDKIDFLSLTEADFIVNAFEDKLSKKSILSAKEKIFKTSTGKKLLDDIFFL
ncbi:MAG: phosphohydrolase, partial [Acutalibacteraceae bacterium]